MVLQRLHHASSIALTVRAPVPFPVPHNKQHYPRTKKKRHEAKPDKLKLPNHAKNSRGRR